MANQWGWLKRFRAEAERYVQEGRVQTIDFSGATYQIAVVDETSENREWPFFQFDEKGDLKDAFCSCETEDGCIHQAAALLKIYGGHSEPLHIRFRNSFWNRLCQILAEHIGYDASNLEKLGKGHYSFKNHISFHIEAKHRSAAEYLEHIFSNNRQKETPENSLKFSNLTQEEVFRWKEGRPSPKLRYELSFWDDLAKNWMLRQEEKIPYTFSFTESSQGLPTFIAFEWTDLKIDIFLSESELDLLIPTFSAIHSPLQVYEEKENKIKSISYEPLSKSFFLQYRLVKDKKEEGEKKVRIGRWWYVPKKGFFSIKEKTFFNKEKVTEEEIPLFLEKYHQEIAPLLKNVPLHNEAVVPSYVIAFDNEWNWHFDTYLFEKGDLQKPLSAFFKNWAYIDGKGFYELEDVLFDTVTTVLPPKEVSHFVNHHRIWLNAQEGFTTHLASIETHLSYVVTPDSKLKFYGKHHTQEDTVGSKDFGDWIYFEKLGFFSKKYARLGLGVRPGIEIPKEAVSHFIHSFHEELEGLPHFFCPFFPLLKRGIKISVHSSSSLEITPEYELLPQYKSEKVQFFEDYLFVEGKGFCELPPKMRLPEEYQESRLIHSENLTEFLEDEMEKIKFFITTLDPKIKKPIKCDLQLDYLARNPEGGLKAQLFYVTDIGKVAVTDIQEAMLKKRRYFFSQAGCFELNDEKFAWIRHQNIPLYPESKVLDLSTLDFLRLETTQGILAPPDISPLSGITRSLLKELREFTVYEKPVLTGLKSELRVYQQSGLFWLWFLYQNGLSGLLCDEMGLGKTHQAMALIASCMSLKDKKERRYLVVCPTSVIYHWQDKLAAFLPQLHVHTYHGTKRTLKKLPKESLILTSYGILRAEKEALKELSFEIAVFDEIQNAKNPHSRIHNALLSIQSKMRVGLTGTPIENNVRELKALFDVVLPGYMPSESRFRETFMIPIEKEGNEEKKALLNQLVKPFILRRRKQEVLQELPEKSIDKSYCDLSEEQIRLYTETLEKSRESVFSTLQNDQTPIPYVHIFSIFSTLKQICNHPALALKEPKNYKNYSSGKWDLFVELLDEAKESEQKVVVFSQYLFMLDIMEEYLTEKGWGFAQIRGDTLNRREQLQKFQEDPNCIIFLGSLQAAGVGIDLTAASVVILYDRWWNAARENQAIDRVHRIGQKRGVQVYKLITKGTIEEKIDRMISKKGRLLEEVITTDDQAELKKFSRTELMELLSYSLIS